MIIDEQLKLLKLFSNDEIESIKLNINSDGTKIKCLIRNKDIKVGPEELVRQLYLYRLLNTYKYPVVLIRVEESITFGLEKKKADIVVCNKNNPDSIYIIIELKQAKLQEGKEQLLSYTHATGSPLAVWTNGNNIEYYHRKDPNYFEKINGIPAHDELFEDFIKSKRPTWRDLILNDKILNEQKNLKDIIKELEDDVLANAGVDAFEECFKLIFVKLYDELKSREDKNFIETSIKGTFNNYKEYREEVEKIPPEKMKRKMEFYNAGHDAKGLKENIQKLLDEAIEKLSGVFETGTLIKLTEDHLAICVSYLQNVKLLNSNLDVIDDAFEYLVSKSSKGEKGQFFTRRFVIDMCVKMLNPKKMESMIDPASGSCGFPMHTIMYKTGKLLSSNSLDSKEDEEAILKVFAIDFDSKSVQVSKTLNLIAGDGKTNVLDLNSLDFAKWNERFNTIEWRDKFVEGLKRLEKYKVGSKDDNHFYNFDLLLTNPPFAGEVKEGKILARYEIAKDNKNKTKKSMGRDILFIERCLDMVRDGGRLCMVLPQGRFNNTSDQDIREFFMEKARVLAVVSLGGNTFKPHTGTKTSVLFLQKWNDDKSNLQYYCPRQDDYEIFFAISEKSGIDNSGNPIYVKEGEVLKTNKLDSHGHYIVDHDLHNHWGDLDKGIAEYFREWAIDQGFEWAKDEVR